MYKLKLAQKSDIPALKSIWKACFEDSDEFVDFFFEEIFQNIYPVVLLEYQKVIGMMYLFPVTSSCGSDCKKGFYVYAVGIHPDYRGKDLFKNHINKALYEYLKKHNLFCVLCPSNQKLSSFYISLGYKKVCTLYSTEISADAYRDVRGVKELSAAELYDMRIGFFDDAIVWSKKELELYLKIIRFSGGEALSVVIDNKVFYCITEKVEKAVRIVETNAESEILIKLCGFLCARNNTDKISVISKHSENANIYIDTLALNFPQKHCYFNFAMQ